MPRSPLFGALREALRTLGAPPERRTPQSWTRRRFLHASALSLCAACGDPRLPAGPSSPRVAIVGAGAAGLSAALRLERAGLTPTLWEASDRSGGRVMTARGLHAPGQWTELGAEFIDSGHTLVRRWAGDLGLTLLDFAVEDGREHETYFFGGAHRSRAELAGALRALAPRIERDLASLGDQVDYRHAERGAALDRTPLAQYFRDIAADDWLASLLEVAYVSEFGLEASEQSALNFLFLYSLETGLLYGASDERYKIRGGNQQLLDGLRERVRAPIALGHRLVAIREAASGVRLSFDRGGTAAEVDADAVILALPFTTLRQVEIGLSLPAVKRRAIAELGYGHNAKLLIGCASRPWRASSVLSDEPFQVAWDASRLQPGDAATLTLFLGGQTGLASGAGTAAERAAAFLPAIERALPGVAQAAAAHGGVHRFHWPSHPHTLGSYACYRPGQWTSIHGAEAEHTPPLYFAGEHCSDEHQGYIEGALRSGVTAAEAVLARADNGALTTARWR